MDLLNSIDSKEKKRKAMIGGNIFLILSCLLLSASCLVLSCGKKGPPTLKSYEKPDPPSQLTAVYRESAIFLSWEFPKEKEQEIKGFYLLKSTLLSVSQSRRVWGNFEKSAFLESNERFFLDKDFTIGFTYKYKIVSQNLNGITSVDSNIVEITPQNSPSEPQ